MIPKRIFLDLDDVCNRFTMYALKRVGCPVDELSYLDFNPRLGLGYRARGQHPASLSSVHAGRVLGLAEPRRMGERAGIGRVQCTALSLRGTRRHGECLHPLLPHARPGLSGRKIGMDPRAFSTADAPAIPHRPSKTFLCPAGRTVDRRQRTQRRKVYRPRRPSHACPPPVELIL